MNILKTLKNQKKVLQTVKSFYDNFNKEIQLIKI